MRFRNEVCGGEATIREYCFNLARNGGRSVAKILGTEVMQVSQDGPNQCCFTNVRLPLQFSHQKLVGPDAKVGLDAAEGSRIVTWLMHRAMHDHKTWIPGRFYGGAAWIRLSAQVYLGLRDFEWAAGVLKKLCERAE